MKALIVVDLQNDLIDNSPKGLSEEIIKMTNRLFPKFPLVIFSRRLNSVNGADVAHLSDDVKFCLGGTYGSFFPGSLKLEKIKGSIYFFNVGTGEVIFGTHSVFYDKVGDGYEQLESTGLKEFLDEKEISEINIVGLNVNTGLLYNTAVDSANLGKRTNIILPDCAEPGDLNIFDDELKILHSLDVNLIRESNLPLFNLVKDIK